MRDFELLPPAVLTICLDLHSLPESGRLFWQDQPAHDLPPALAERMICGPNFWKTRPRSRPRTRRSPNGYGKHFADTGLDITAAHSGDDAVELLRILRFDLVVMCGDSLGAVVPSLIGQIRLIAPGLKCIVVSATMSKHREQSIREAGVLALLDTPMPMVQLHEVASMVALRARTVTT